MSISQSPEQGTARYSGPERRKSPRIQANYPICIRSVLPSGENVERYLQTQNVSSGGVLFTIVGTLEPGTELDVSIGIPFPHVPSLPAAQLDGLALVLRCEPLAADEGDVFRSNVALKFLETPKLSTEISMFDW